jgi:hypothetical protein
LHFDRLLMVWIADCGSRGTAVTAWVLERFQSNPSISLILQFSKKCKSAITDRRSANELHCPCTSSCHKPSSAFPLPFSTGASLPGMLIEPFGRAAAEAELYPAHDALLRPPTGWYGAPQCSIAPPKAAGIKAAVVGAELDDFLSGGSA